MLLAGLLAIFATYWDESWHTDIGRDSAWVAPHILLYGSVAIAGIGVVWWGLRGLVAARSLRATLAHPPLLAAGLGPQRRRDPHLGHARTPWQNST